MTEYVVADKSALSRYWTWWTGEATPSGSMFGPRAFLTTVGDLDDSRVVVFTTKRAAQVAVRAKLGRIEKWRTRVMPMADARGLHVEQQALRASRAVR